MTGSYLSMIDKDLEKGVHKKNAICQNAAAIKKNRLKQRISASVEYGKRVRSDMLKAHKTVAQKQDTCCNRFHCAILK